MSAVLPVEPPRFDPSPFAIARFSVDQYHRMIASGAFSEDDEVELIDGWAVKKMAQGPRHEDATAQVEELLRNAVSSEWHVRNQAPITLPGSEPEPDIAVARGARADFRDRHPFGSEIALVVEVSETTLSADRLKGLMYAAAGIPVYRIVNLGANCLEVYSQPGAAESQGYAERTTLTAGADVELRIEGAPPIRIPVARMLP